MSSHCRPTRCPSVQGGRSHSTISEVLHHFHCGVGPFTGLTVRDRPDTIRCIVASLVGDGESGDSLVDENEPIQPLQQAQFDDYTDHKWEPEPIDAGPGISPYLR